MSMRQLCFEVVLEEDAVISQHSGTAGGHKSLLWLPGAVFAGAMARDVYKPGEADTWTIFHSGKVRILPAYPLAEDGTPALPTPLAFHTEKAAAKGPAEPERLPCDDTKMIMAHVHNLAMPRAVGQSPRSIQAKPGDSEPLRQPQRIKPAFLDAYGDEVKPKQVVIPKTATHGGVARDQHLFAYQVVRAGTRFGLRIDVDADVARDIDTTIVAALTERPIRVGRSRSAEFGSARVTMVKDANWSAPTPGTTPDGSIVLYCHTDVMLLDPMSGQPTLTPRAEHFHLLSGYRLDAARSFIETRRYAPFNAHRRLPDAERQVIVQGSTLVFAKSDKPEVSGGAVDVVAVANSLGTGVGAHRETGLGQVWVNPPFLMASPPPFKAGSYASAAVAASAQMPAGDPLLAWLTASRAEQAELRDASRLAWDWAECLAKHIPASGGLTRSQWAVLRTEAASVMATATDKPLDKLLTRLFGEEGDEHAADGGDSGDGRGNSRARRERQKGGDGLLVAGVRGRKWGRSYMGSSPREALRARLVESRSTGRHDDRVVLRAVQVLALRMPRLMQARNLGVER